MVVLGVIAWGMLAVAPVMGEVVPVDTAMLTELARPSGGKVRFPKDSQMAKAAQWGGSIVSVGILAGVAFQFPRAQAATFAARAKNDFIKLDSTNWRPELFNAGVRVDVVGIESDMTSLVQAQRIACILPNDSLVDPLWTVLDTVEVSNLAGATLHAVNLRALFPVSIFNLNQDLSFYVFSDRGRSKAIRVSAKELAKKR
jgi:hypothetical protein